MAGSLNHIIDDATGAFRFDLIENMGDAHEACEACFDVIAALLELLPPGDRAPALVAACTVAKTPVPECLPVFGLRVNGSA